MSNLTVDTVVNAVWTTLNGGKRLHPRVNKEGVKKEIETAVEALLDTQSTSVDVKV